MSQDFVTELRLQLREAALREERRAPLARRIVRARRALPGPGPVVGALAAALLALVIAVAAVTLRGEPEPAEPTVVGTYAVASGLSPLAPGFGAVWTADPIAGEILRIDPATRRVAARIPVPGEARVATGAGAVWAVAGQLQAGGDPPLRLLRIDPGTNRVVARIPLRTPAGDGFGPVDIQVEGGAVWVVGVVGALRVDPRRNAADHFVPLADETGEGTRGAVIDGDGIWVLTVDGRLRQLDAATGRAVREARVRVQPESYLFGGPEGTLTLLGREALARLEPATGRALWRAPLGGEIRHWMEDDAVLWTHVSREPRGPDRLVRLDAESGRPNGRVDLPERGVAGMARVGPDVWVATPGGTIIVVRG